MKFQVPSINITRYFGLALGWGGVFLVGGVVLGFFLFWGCGLVVVFFGLSDCCPFWSIAPGALVRASFVGHVVFIRGM